MVDTILRWHRDGIDGSYVRPWGLAAPVLVLLVCLPLLRPLRFDEFSDNEQARLATVQAIVEHGTLAIDDTSFSQIKQRISVANRDGEPRGVKHFSRQGPVMAALLAGPYWVMHRFGLDLKEDAALVAYLLTLIGVTLPVTAVAALIYRMGRLFELSRPWRMTLAIVCVFGSGLVSYATALNSHAPAAALIVGASACLLHASMSKKERATHGWVAIAGLCAGLASVIDFGAFIFLMLLTLVLLAIRWSPAAKLGAIACYVLGALPALALHMALNVPITGDLRPGFLHPELAADARPAGRKPILVHPATRSVEQNAESLAFEEDDETWLEDEEYPTLATVAALNFADGVLGPHGLLSHFPVLLFGVGGIFVVLHRHWPVPLKTLAVVAFVGGLTVIGIYVVLNPDFAQPMFSTRWFVLFLPLVIFFAGAWVRRQHHPVLWGVAGTLAGFSIVVSLLGAAAPFTPSKQGEYTVYAAVRQILKVSPRPSGQVVAEGRVR